MTCNKTGRDDKVFTLTAHTTNGAVPQPRVERYDGAVSRRQFGDDAADDGTLQSVTVTVLTHTHTHTHTHIMIDSWAQSYTATFTRYWRQYSWHSPTHQRCDTPTHVQPTTMRKSLSTGWGKIKYHNTKIAIYQKCLNMLHQIFLICLAQ